MKVKNNGGLTVVKRTFKKSTSSRKATLVMSRNNLAKAVLKGNGNVIYG